MQRVVKPTLRICALALLLTTCTAPWLGDAVREEAQIRLFRDLGDLQHPVTATPEAQRYFDQGLLLTFGFNHDAAVRSFREAQHLDRNCAMCFWGEALALGPNINAPMGPRAAREAFAAVTWAVKLAPNVSAREQAYIEALATRYVREPLEDRSKLDRAYADAMRKLHQRYPDDMDAATLFAEALMDLNPWNHWDRDGNPVAETPEIVRTLEYVLKHKPDHPGANHYYIHAVEASKHPEQAEAAADRLTKLAPDSGHLTHMPSHIYIRVGRYNDAALINKKAAQADEEYFSWCKSQGIYRALYYPHNIHFIWATAAEDGQSEVALMAARELVAKVPPKFDEMPFLEDFLPTPTFALLRFGRWDAVLAEPKPAENLRYATGIWHYARGLALLREGNVGKAQQELEILDRIAREPVLAKIEFFGGTAQKNLWIASQHLSGEIATQRGDYDTGVKALEKAVRLQDSLNYTEPPPWYFPTRHALGAALLKAGRPQDAEAAYRRDLQMNPRNGWSLFGLAQSLRAQGRTADAALVERGFEQSWARADVKLEASRF